MGPRAQTGGSGPAKVDLKRTLPDYTAPRGEFARVRVPSRRYLAIDGHGDPNTSPRYTEAVESLFPLAYAVKFASRRIHGRDYVVMPLEGLWWADDMAAFTTARDKAAWSWTLLNLLPPWIADAELEAAREVVRAKGTAPCAEQVRVLELDEGECVQTLHVGPYDAEGPVLARLHEEYLPAHGLVMTGRHHEIYLGDVRRSAPEKLRTILRQPVSPARG